MDALITACLATILYSIVGGIAARLIFRHREDDHDYNSTEDIDRARSSTVRYGIVMGAIVGMWMSVWEYLYSLDCRWVVLYPMIHIILFILLKVSRM